MQCVQCEKGATGRSKYCPVHRAEAHAAWRTMVSEKTGERVQKVAGHAELWDQAVAAGHLAATGHTPTPMVVARHAHPMDDNSPVEQSWTIPSGVCGFAWVIVRPGTCSFARWLVKTGKGSKDYRSGINVWCRAYGQSYERKMAWASAVAGVLAEAGINAYSDGRLD